MRAAAGANNRQYEHKRMIDTEDSFLQFLPAIKNSEKNSSFRNRTKRIDMKNMSRICRWHSCEGKDVRRTFKRFRDGNLLTYLGYIVDMAILNIEGVSSQL